MTAGDYLDDLERLEKSATPAPWVERGDDSIEGDENGYAEVVGRGPVDCMTYCYGGTSSIEWGDNDRELTIAARNALPKLLAELRSLRATCCETATRWKLVSDVPDRGDCHGHLFDTEDEAKSWCAQPYIQGRYRYEKVQAAKCSSCGLFHIPLDGDRAGWSCQDVDWSPPVDPLAKEVESLRAVRDAAEDYLEYLKVACQARYLEGVPGELMDALDAHRKQEANDDE